MVDVTRRAIVAAELRAGAAAIRRAHVQRVVAAAPPIIRIVGGVERDPGDWTTDYVGVRRVAEDLHRCRGAAEIALLIDSPGGDFATARKIYNLIRAHPGRITARITGTCASAATVIALAADWREAVPSARFLLHEASVDPHVARGQWTAGVHRKVASAVEAINEEMARFYAGRIGRPVADFRAVMARARPMTAAAALDIGLLHAVLDPAGGGPLAPASVRR